MRYPPDHNRYPMPEDDAPPEQQGKRRARTIRDMFAQENNPLKRFTSGPARRKRAARDADEPPDHYDLGPDVDQPPRSKTRWTEPGAYLQDGPPDQTDPRNRRRSRSADEQPNNWRGEPQGPARAPRAPYAEPRAPQADPRAPYADPRAPQADPRAPYADPRAPQADPRAPYAEPRAPYAEPGSGSSGRQANADLRWQRPDWLGAAPPVNPANAAPPVDPAPPTTPRYPLHDSATPQYEPVERDPNRQETDYRATSVRAALWASRTPAYEPDRPAMVVERDTTDEREYFEAYATRRTPASLAHAEASMSSAQTGTYTPGATSEVERLRREAKSTGRTFGPAPYFWDMVKKPRSASPLAVGLFWVVSLIVFVSALLSAGYAGVSVYAASKLAYAPQVAVKGTPKDAGLAYKDVTFLSRSDHVLLRGWFIPGVTAAGQLSATRAIIMAHGPNSNRTDPDVGELSLSEALAKQGFAVLVFDLRGSGESASAPTSQGYLEQHDILGAVDFLKSGTMPYPNLGRPKAIGAWGVSTGAVAVLLAAAQEPALRAIVADSAFADATPLAQRDIPATTHLSSRFTPGILEAEQVMYGIDFTALKPVNVVARIAPRPLLFIQGADDTVVPPNDMTLLSQAAQQGQGAHVQSWMVQGAKDGQAYHVVGQAYISRVVAFFDANLTPAA